MVSLMDVYDSFLSKVNEDDWAHCYSEDDLKWFTKDWRAFLNSAIPYFKFPRCSLKRHYDEDFPEDSYFEDDLNDQEIQIIATLMKKEWLDRTINTWENVKAMYDERDFSQANLLDKFIKLSDKTEKQCIKLQKLYSRSIQDEDGRRKSYQFSKWAGGKNE